MHCCHSPRLYAVNDGIVPGSALSAPTAYFLVSHGSRDPRSQVALQQLAHAFTQAFVTQHPSPDSSQPWVHTGTLEFGPHPLNQQIQEFAEQLIDKGVTQLDILPLFLLPGTHVKQDIPAAVTAARQQLGQSIRLRLRPHLGSHSRMGQLLRDRISAQPQSAQILLAHGSRYPGGNKPVEHLAAQLGAVPAYWTGGPNLETCISELTANGHDQIGILPYFLFTGGITDALQEQINQLQWRFNFLNLSITSPLEPSLKMAGLLLDLI